MNDESKWEIRSKMGMVFQNPDNQFIGTSVQDDIAFSLENLNMSHDEMQSRISEALEMVGLSHYRFHDPSLSIGWSETTCGRLQVRWPYSPSS